MSAPRILRVLLAILALTILFSGGCSAPEPTATPQPSPTPKPQPIDLVVLHTNDVMGHTEPCG